MMKTIDPNVSFIRKVSFVIVLLGIFVSYYFTLLASSSAGGWEQLFVLLGVSILCPIVGSIIAITILWVLKKLNKKTALSAIFINALAVFNIFLVPLFGLGVSTISEYAFKIYGVPTVEVLELNFNQSNECEYKLMVKNNSPFPIINARLWEGSLVFIEFKNVGSYPALECVFLGQKFLNIYPGENVIHGTTEFMHGSMIPTFVGTTIPNTDYKISAYMGIDMYGRYHQLRFDYSEQKQVELFEKIKSSK